MKCLTAVLVVGLLVQQVICQGINPAMLAALSAASSGTGGGGAGGLMGMNPLGLGLYTAEMGGSMQDMLLAQALTSPQSGGGGGIDPTMLLLAGAGGAPGMTSDVMQQMMIMNMLRGNQQEQTSGGNQQGQQQQAGMATNIANMLAGPAGTTSEITPSQQNALWGVVHMTQNSQRIMDAVTTPADRIALERDGLPGINPVMVMNMCPPAVGCGFAFCENTEIPFTPETFYVCRGCPRCRMDSSQRNLMNMMSRMGGGSAARQALPFPMKK